MKSETSESPLKCRNCALVCACGKEFKYESEKRRHEQSHVPQFECKVCSKKFSFVSALRRHEKQHERMENVQCKKCGKTFRDETLLKRHKEYAHRGTHKCKKCSATLHSKLALRLHMKTHRPESERKFHCSYDGCGKTFNFTHHLKHHELTHTDDKPHVCECGKRFIQLHHLKIHQRVHKPESWLPCPVLHCQKYFSNEYALRRHITTHKPSAADIKIPRHEKLQDKIKIVKKKTAPKNSGNKEKKVKEEVCVSTSLKTYVKQVINITAENGSTIDNLTDIVDRKYLDVQFEELDKVTTGNSEDFENKVDTINENVELDDIELSTSNCTSFFGKCLETGDTETNESCLCAQISTKKKKNKISEAQAKSPNNYSPNVKLIDDLQCIEKRFKDVNACETCECASTCGIINKSAENVAYENPKLEKRNDNIVKIKDTFDIDFDNIANYENEIHENVFNSKAKVDMLNSCKDILGNCIVSGDGTIGEGCLCAKMTANNQEVIAQEIEEITPCPKNNLFKPL